MKQKMSKERRISKHDLYLLHDWTSSLHLRQWQDVSGTAEANVKEKTVMNISNSYFYLLRWQPL